MMLLLPILFISPVIAWINYEAEGFASLTHYDLPRDALAACGCTSTSTHYPTAAMSQMAYGSSNAFGPACGKCFRLSLLNTFLSDPPFYPPSPVSLVVKVTDLCPLSEEGWCSGTETKKNEAGHQINFDLAFPSRAIPEDFFPSNVSFYGYEDFGVWNISYTVVPCIGNWAGAGDTYAMGSDPNQGPEGACCPGNPTGSPNDTCPSYSDRNGIAPDTRSNLATRRVSQSLTWLPVLSFILPFV